MAKVIWPDNKQEFTGKLPEHRQMEAIKAACLHKLQARFRFEADKDIEFDTHLLDTGRDGLERYISIIAPSQDIAERPTRGAQLMGTFEWEATSLYFVSPFLAATIVKGPDDKVMEAWKLGFPPEIYQIQRRAHYRVRADSKQKTPLDIYHMQRPDNLMQGAPSAAQRESAKPVWQRRPLSLPIRGFLWDMSGGGLSFTLGPDSDATIKRDDRLEIEIGLMENMQPIKLPAKVVFIKKNFDGENVYCLEFVDIEGSVENKQNHKYLMQFISEREREIIAGLKHERFKRPSGRDQGPSAKG